MISRLQSWLNYLTSDPVGFIVYALYLTVTVLLSLILHECAHGYVAYRCGDPTAKMLGRLSLDPRKHLDPIGTLCLVFLGFGWAKPVPVNPRNFNGNYRRDDFLVSVAGITVNLTLFIVSMGLAVALNGLLWKPEVIAANGGAKEFLSTSGVGYSVLVAGYGRDYSELMLHPWLMYVQRFLLMFYSMNLGVGLFNLLPIPPLDGYHLFNDLLFKGRFRLNQQVFQIAQIVLLLACFSGVLNNVINVIFDAVEGGVLNLFLLIAGQA